MKVCKLVELLSAQPQNLDVVLLVKVTGMDSMFGDWGGSDIEVLSEVQDGNQVIVIQVTGD